MQSRKVLVIEDNRDAADSMCLLLRFKGYLARTAFTGPEGVRLAREWHPDFILCDIGLPGLNGFEVADLLHHDPSTADIHLIAVSGYGSAQDHEHAAAVGFEHFYTKPADPDALLEVLRTTAVR
jgi:CheY-like chemotaxis protein